VFKLLEVTLLTGEHGNHVHVHKSTDSGLTHLPCLVECQRQPGELQDSYYDGSSLVSLRSCRRPSREEYI
jgi:hypothetical protein